MVDLISLPIRILTSIPRYFYNLSGSKQETASKILDANKVLDQTNQPPSSEISSEKKPPQEAQHLTPNNTDVNAKDNNNMGLEKIIGALVGAVKGAILGVGTCSGAATTMLFDTVDATPAQNAYIGAIALAAIGAYRGTCIRSGKESIR